MRWSLFVLLVVSRNRPASTLAEDLRAVKPAQVLENIYSQSAQLVSMGPGYPGAKASELSNHLRLFSSVTNE